MIMLLQCISNQSLAICSVVYSQDLSNNDKNEPKETIHRIIPGKWNEKRVCRGAGGNMWIELDHIWSVAIRVW